MVTEGGKGLQRLTEGYKDIQKATGGLQNVTGNYREL